MPLPVTLLIIKVCEWSGDYLVLVFFLTTTLVELVILWAYPRFIYPLSAKLSPLPDKYDSLRSRVKELTRSQGFDMKKLLMEELYSNDMHVNA